MDISSKQVTASEEYYFLQREVGRFDDITHKIKNWSITVSFALVGAAFYQKVPAIFLLASGVSSLFWLTEARWKRYQRIHMARLEEVEDFLLGDREDYEGPAIHRSFRKRLGPWQQALSEEWKAAKLKNVQLPHNLIVLTGIALFAFFQFEIIDFPKPPK